MDVRREFVERAKLKERSFSALCAEYGVSRKTGYVWLKRGRTGEYEDHSRKPLRSPLRVSADVVAAVIRAHGAHPFWGPKKLSVVLKPLLRRQTPAPRTIQRILERSGLTQRKRRIRRREKPEAPAQLPIPTKPNDLWTVDFKGWWLCKSKERCEPLTVRDAYSRMILALEVLPSTAGAPVEAIFKRLFEKYGLPAAVQTDNGTPFITPSSWHGLSRLSVWWTSLGIEHHRSRLATPSDNGGHERMHRNVAEEIERFAALNRDAQQEACDRWRHDWNHHRPHESLRMKTPADVYRRSRIFLSDVITEPEYPDMHRRRVTTPGTIRYKDRRLFLSTTLVGREVGLKPTDDQDVLELWLFERKLGLVDFTLPRPKFRSAKQLSEDKNRSSAQAAGNNEGRRTGT